MSLLLIVAISLVIIELVYFRLARHWNIIDNPNERSSHKSATIRGGGVIFPIAVLIFFFASGFSYPWFMSGLVLIAFVSFLDDIKPLSTKIRLGVHLSALLLMFYQLGLFSEPIWLIPFLLILCVGIINAWNFMDGINGITGGYSFIVLGALAWVNQYRIEFIDPQFLAVILIALVIFNFFNFRIKAKCFAGDVGSISIAFIILFALGLLMLNPRDFSWICFLAVYGIDSLLTIFHRILLKENITIPHRKHLYQLLANELKIPHVVVSSLYVALQFLVVAGFLYCRSYGNLVVWSYLVSVLIVLSVFYATIKRKWFHLHGS